jgi:hypothetical protein
MATNALSVLSVEGMWWGQWGEMRNIQVKRISSRRFLTPEAARNRIAGRPFNVKRLVPGGELWVFDQDDRLYVFKGDTCIRGA